MGSNALIEIEKTFSRFQGHFESSAKNDKVIASTQNLAIICKELVKLIKEIRTIEKEG